MDHPIWFLQAEISRPHFPAKLRREKKGRKEETWKGNHSTQSWTDSWAPEAKVCFPFSKLGFAAWPVESYKHCINKLKLFPFTPQEENYRCLISQTWYVPCNASTVREVTTMGRGRGHVWDRSTDCLGDRGENHILMSRPLISGLFPLSPGNIFCPLGSWGFLDPLASIQMLFYGKHF